MGLNTVTFQALREVRNYVLEMLQQYRNVDNAADKRVVLIVDSYRETVQWKHYLAQNGAGFGIAVHTFSSWLTDMWELFGDGGAPVSASVRSMFLQAASADQPLTPGYISLLSRAVSLGCSAACRLAREDGVLNKDGALPGIDASANAAQGKRAQDASTGDSQDASDREKRITDLVDAYDRLLSQHDYIEPTQMMAFLLEARALHDTVVICCDVQLSVLQRRFLEHADACQLVRLEWESEGAPGRPAELMRLQHDFLQPNFDDPIQSEGALRFALPSGTYASYALIQQELLIWFSEHERSRVAVVCPQPLEWFDQLKGNLSQRGVTSSVQTRKAFIDTRFGNAWCALLRLVSQSESGRIQDLHLAGDFALSSFSAVPLRGAQKCDVRFRSCRAKTLDDIFNDLTGYAAEDHRDIMAAFSEGSYAEALDAIVSLVASCFSWPQALRNESLAAIALAKQIHAMADNLGLSVAQVTNRPKYMQWQII